MLASGAFGYLTDYLLWWLLLVSLFVHTWCFFSFFPREGHRVFRLVAGNTLIFLCMLGIVAMAGETYLRFVCVETDAFGMSLPARRWFALHTRLNSMGCRDNEWTVERRENVRRIAFVGDSFTYGWGIERVEDRFTERVAAAFERRSPHAVEVMNVAKPGWDTGAQLAPIRDLIDRYGVDEVILCYVPNDIEKLLVTTDDFDPTRPPEPFLFDPDRSCLLDHLYRTLWVPRVDTVAGYHDWLAEGYGNEETWHLHQRQLGDMMRYCRDHDVVFRVVLLPFIQTSGTKLDPPALHAHIARFFRTNSVEVLDLLPSIAGLDPAELKVNKHDAHPNELAHRLFADAIRQAFYAAKPR